MRQAPVHRIILGAAIYVAVAVLPIWEYWAATAFVLGVILGPLSGVLFIGWLVRWLNRRETVRRDPAPNDPPDDADSWQDRP
ncbi:MAG: hypothetical protein JSS02_00610 [Planctomycetes bacterium]|nr:hypothetical protein [Planctomycetota bacterium]